MSTQTIELLERALELPRAERLALVDRLIRSMDSETAADAAPSPAWKEAWEKEMESRIERYESGQTQSREWRESIDAIRKKLRRKQLGTIGLCGSDRPHTTVPFP